MQDATNEPSRMADLISRFDWASTPLGAIESWPQSLKTALDIMLGSGHAMQLAWGRERTVLYNDAYAPMLGARHPGALGLPFREAWPDIWDEIEPLVSRGFAGETVRFQDMPLVLIRHGPPEDTWWNLSFSPVRDESGAIAGLLSVTVDATARIRAEAALRRSEERQQFLLRLSDALRPLNDAEEIRLTAATVLGQHLKANRVAYAEHVPEVGFNVTRNYLDGATEAAGHFRYADYGPDILSQLQAGITRVQPDIRSDPRLDEAQKQALARAGVGASLNVPLVKSGRLVGFLGVNYSAAHDFDEQEIGLVTDVAERTWAAVERARAESALREREADLARVQRIGRIGGLNVDVASGLRSWRSPEYLQLHGLSADTAEETHEDWLARVHPEDRERAEKALLAALQSDSRVYESEYRIVRPSDGEIRWIHVRADIERGADGKPQRLVGAHVDVTVQKSVEHALRESEERLGLAIEIGEMASWDWDLGSGEVTWNDRHFLMQGYAVGEVPPSYEAWLARVHPEDREEVVALIEKARDSRTTYVHEFRSRHANGRIVWCSARGRFFYQADGQPYRMIGVMEDVTARKETEIALRETQERHAFLLRLSDTIRAEPDASSVGKTALRLVAEHLEVDRAYICHLSRSKEWAFIEQECRPGLFSVEGEYDLRTLPSATTHILSRPLFYADVPNDPTLTDRDKQSVQAMGMAALMSAVLARDEGDFIWTITVGMTEPRAWTPAELRLLQEAAERVWTVMQRVAAETALRESEKRQAFLLKLSDALRALADPAAIQSTASRLLVEHVGAHRAMYLELEGSEEPRFAVIRGQYAHGIPLFPNRVPYADFANGFPAELLQARETLVVDDTANDPRLNESVRASWFGTNAAAAITTSLIKDGRMVANFGLHSAVARQWTAPEIRLVEEVADRTWAAVERGRAESAVRENEERQAFLLDLNDVLRPLSSPVEIMTVFSEKVGSHYRVGRCGYAEVPPPYDRLVVTVDWTDGVMQSLQGTWPLESFGQEAIAQYRTGKTLVFSDTFEDAMTRDHREGMEAARGVRSSISVQLMKQGQWVASFYVQDTKPRRWTPSEILLMEELAERSWSELQRARSEAALRESEERFQQFAAASSGALWIRSAKTLKMEYVSPAISTIYGIEPGRLLNGVESWAAQILPEDRDRALVQIERARQGESVTHEFRIQRPSDRAFRWIRNIDFPLRDDQGRIQRIGGIAEDVTEAKLAVEHQGVLLAELQHRVRNIMAIIRSITARTAKNADSVPEYAERMAGRLLALARVQALLTRAANAKVGIRSIVQDELSAQAHHEAQYVVEGPDVELSSKAAEVVTLAIHELATNALKYGALSVPNGKVGVTWRTVERHGVPWLVFDWTEEGAPEIPGPATDSPRRQGFGSELIEGRIPYELKGRGRLVIEPGGARCHLEFPLKEGASVLETGAPQRATVFGGALDTTGEADLSGYRVLVVEDDYYLATDAARALRGAGARVMGPSCTEDAARAELLEQRPDAVLLDINLGPGPSFKLAEKLLDDGIPFVFVTGYDRGMIPPEFAGVERMEKPVQLRQIVSAIAKLLPSA